MMSRPTYYCGRSWVTAIFNHVVGWPSDFRLFFLRVQLATYVTNEGVLQTIFGFHPVQKRYEKTFNMIPGLMAEHNEATAYI